MIVKSISYEDFVNYKVPSMVLMFPRCTFKCERDCGERVCQNSALAKSPDIIIDADEVCKRYLSNPITKAIVCGGLEPMDSFDELCELIYCLRIKHKCDDDIVIYTGYTEQECERIGWLQSLRDTQNIIVKFGRFVPNQPKHYDPALGVMLASQNQYGKRL